MNEILTELSKPVWWISVVVAGIAINLLSAYLKGPLDKTILSTSSWWRGISIKRQQEWEMRVKGICSSAEIKNEEMHNEIRQRLQSHTLLLQAIFVLILPLFASPLGTPLPPLLAITFLGATAFLFFGAFLAFLRAVTTRNALHEARMKANNSFKRTPGGAT